MTKRVFVGASSAALHNQWMNDVRQLLNQGNRRLFYLLPTGTLIKKFRDQMMDSAGKGIVGHVEGTFDDLIHMILGGQSYRRLHDFEQEWLLEQVLEKLPMGHPFGGRNKEIILSTLYSAIQELKQSGIKPKDVKASLGNQAIYADALVNVYDSYQKLLGSFPGNPMDEADLYQLAISEMHADPSRLQEKLEHLYLENFVDLSPLQRELLVSIVPHVPIVNLHFLWDDSFEEEVPVAAANHRLLLEKLQTLGFTIESCTKDKSYPEVSLIPAITAEKEVRDIFREIKRFSREGIPYTDIAIAVTDDDYRRHIIDVASECGVPITESEKLKLSQSRIIRDWNELLLLKTDDFQTANIISVFKSPYLGESGLLDGFVSFTKTELLSGTASKLIETLDSKMAAEGMAKWKSESLADWKSWIERTSVMLNAIPEQGTLEEICQALLAVFRLQGFEQRLLLLLQKGSLTLEHYKRDSLILTKYISIVKRLITTAKNLPFERKFTIFDVLSTINRSCSEEGVTMSMGYKSGVRVTHPSSFIADSVKILFCPGMNERAQTPQNWLIKGLKSSKLPLREWERLLFSFELDAAEEHLIFSFVSPKLNETVLLSSVLEDFLRDSEIDWTQTALHHRDACHTLPYPKYAEPLSQVEQRAYYAKKISQNSIGATSIDNWWKSLVTAAQVERDRQKGQFSEWNGLITHPLLRSQIEAQFSDDKIYSASELDVLAGCSFRFLLQRIIKLTEDEQGYETLSPVDRGTLIHDILQTLYSEGVKGGFIHNIQRLDERLHSLFQALTEKHEQESKLATSPYWQLEKRSLLHQLRKFIAWDYSDWRSKVGAVPAYFELSFGMTDDGALSNPVTLDLGEGTTIKLRGRVDRVDIKDGYFVIIDYKGSLGNIPSANHILKGAALQLPLYMLVLSDWLKENGRSETPAGGYYFSYSHAQKRGLGDKSLGRNPIESMPDALDVLKENIRTQLKELKNANFSLKPKYCSAYCPYAEVCRFNRKQPVREEVMA